MIALGINEDHNASAALLKDGKVVACAFEERFTGIKNDLGYPHKAIEFVLSACGVRPEDCDCVVYGSLTQDPVMIKIKLVCRFTIKDYVREMHEYWKPVLLEKRPSSFWEDIQNDERLNNPQGVYYNFDFMKTTPKDKWNDAFRQERINVVSKHLGIPPEKITFVDHHKAHAYYAYFSAPLDRSRKTLVVTADGWGDDCNGTLSIAQADTIKEIHRTAMCNLARIYRWITLILGLRPNEHEYKVMGLAPYANEYIKKPAYNIFKETLVVDGLDFKWKTKPSDLYFYFRDRFEREGVRFDGIAAGLQQWVEEITTQWIDNALKELSADQVVFSGGLSMNVKVNKAIAELPRVRDFFVSPSGGDESLCIGATYIACNKKDNLQPIPHAYLGSFPDEKEIEAAFKEYNIGDKFEVINQPTPETVADLLIQGKVIGRCVGNMEFGARALGNRSILCDPSKWENVRKINEKIKRRDFWMPFTPSILAERADDYLVNPKRLKAPFMTVAFDSTPLAREHLKAAVHPYDFTVRPQILEKEVNQSYYAIIKAFEKRTGIGAVLNTSFNLHGKPMVRTAGDAWHTFVNSGLDGLLLPGSLILKREK